MRIFPIGDGGWGRNFGVTAIIAVAMASVAACGSSAPVDPYAAEIAAAKRDVSSPFEKAVMTDGKITTQEYEEANQRWLACMHKTYPPTSAVQISLQRDAVGRYSTIVSGLPKDQPTTAYDKTADACMKGATWVVGPLYNSIKSNPRHLSLAAMMVACLKRIGAVPKSYTEENWNADQYKDIKENQPAFDRSKITKFTTDDPGYLKCLENPNRSDG